MGDVGGQYTRSQVAYLLSLTRDDAIAIDAGQPDSCAHFSEDGHSAATAHVEWDPVMTIAMWHDVHAARRRVVRSKLGVALVDLRTRGYTEHEIAGVLGLSRSAARRRFRASFAEICDELGGVAEDTLDDRVSIVSACMSCGQRPRAYIEERYRKLRGGARRTVRKEHRSSLCIVCLPDGEATS